MKTIKRTVFAFTAVAMLAATTQSCKKTVTPGKLDGEWEVTAGSGSSSYTSGGVTNTSTSTYDGKVETTTYGSVSTSTDKTMSYTFDKKAGTFTSKQVTKSTSSKQSTTVYPDNTCSWSNGETVDRVTTAEVTSDLDGIFSISGSSGEIEKNTRIVLQHNGEKKVTNYTYSYFNPTSNASYDVTNKYMMSNGGCVPVKTTEKVEVEKIGQSPYAHVWTVDELKKGVMEISEVFEEERKEAGVTEKHKEEHKWTLTQVK